VHAHNKCRIPRMRFVPRTSVADMPGYPTKKLLFGFPDTRTLADAICSMSQPALGAAAVVGRQSGWVLPFSGWARDVLQCSSALCLRASLCVFGF
jgi:hypothetical protein